MFRLSIVCAVFLSACSFARADEFSLFGTMDSIEKIVAQIESVPPHKIPEGPK